MEFDLEDPITSSDDELRLLFAAESDQKSALAGGILESSARRDAASLILQAQFTCSLDPFVTYLAVNYVDRFLSKQEIPRGKPWIVRLLSISCLSLASKMNGTDFSLANFQREEGFIFDAQSIRRMELLVLGALGWRMRSITPFSFLRFFVSFVSPGHPPVLHALKSHASQTLFKAQNEIKMLEFKPSLVAAAALLSAARELFPIQFAGFRSAISSCEYVNKEKLRECCNAMAGFALDGCDSSLEMISSSDTPVTVLGHHHCPSSGSERTIGSFSSDCDLKKGRISGMAAAFQLPRACD